MGHAPVRLGSIRQFGERFDVPGRFVATLADPDFFAWVIWAGVTSAVLP